MVSSLTWLPSASVIGTIRSCRTRPGSAGSAAAGDSRSTNKPITQPSRLILAPSRTRCSLISASELLAEELHDRRVEFAVKCHAIELRRRIGADARLGRGLLRRARREEGEVAGRNDVNVGLAQ